MDEVETPRCSRLFVAAAEEDELIDLMIVNQIRKMRERELRNGSSVRHR